MTAKQKIEFNNIINTYFEELIDKIIENQQNSEDAIIDKIEEYENYDTDYYDPDIEMLNKATVKIRSITNQIIDYVTEMI